MGAVLLNQFAHHVLLSLEGVSGEGSPLQKALRHLMDDLLAQDLFLAISGSHGLHDQLAVSQFHQRDQRGEVFTDHLAVDGQQFEQCLALAQLPLHDDQRQRLRIDRTQHLAPTVFARRRNHSAGLGMATEDKAAPLGRLEVLTETKNIADAAQTATVGLDRATEHRVKGKLKPRR